MTSDELIKQVQENASEYLEMTEDPAALVAGILAKKVINLMDHITYLERRLKNENFPYISR
jgi:hypothetical protein